MHAPPQKVVNRAATPVVNRASKSASAAQAVRANPAPSRAPPAGEKKVSSPHVARMAGSIVQRKPVMAGKADGAVSALIKPPSSSKVAQYLVTQGVPALLRGIGNLQKQKRNEQTHDDAGEKRQQSEIAVLIPPSERQSISNSGQVNAVSSKPEPTPDENKAKTKLEQSLVANIPKTLGEVDEFKDDKKAQLMGADVMHVVQRDKDAVSSAFKQMEQTPTPAPENTPPGLPSEEVAPPTPNMNLGDGTIAPLQKEHTDVSAYTKEADSKLKEESITQEQLDMVDSGDLAEANKEKKGLEKTAKTEPLAVQKFAQQEAANVDKDLKQEEKKERDELRRQRKAGLGATAQKQKGTKTALEKKREEIGDKINGIFTAAQDKVKRKLADLETQSMKRFDVGNAKASKEFEDNVERELDAYKDERYSGITGRLKKAKDWLLGMDDLPGVKRIFDRNRAAFVTTINRLVDEITADNKRVIRECVDELANAKKEIKGFVEKLSPGLQTIGKKAAEEMDSKLDELDQFVNRKAEELQHKLKDKQQAAIKAIDEKIEKMKEAMAGALAKLGKLLLWAAKKFFTWALGKFGCSLAEIESIINKGVAVLKAIFTQPIQFVKNLMHAAITGFKNFGKNFLVHLKNALFEWLTGSLEGLVLPKTWDLPGIIGVALQMIGISYQNIRKHMVTVMGEAVVAGLEKTFTLVKTLITEGPMAAWEQLKEMAGEMRDAFVEAVKDFIKTKIIEQAIQWLISIFIPGAGIIKAIIGIYDTVVFFIKKAKQIAQMIGNFLSSIAEIAAGNIGAAADAMESGLARGLSLVINFLASLLRLSGITDQIRTAIQKIRSKVDAAMLKVAKWIAAKASQIWSTVKAGAKSAVAKVFNWAFAKSEFKDDDGQSHSVFVQIVAEAPRLTIASNPMAAEQFLDFYVDKKGATFRKDNAAKILAVRTAITAAKAVVAQISTAQKAGKGDAALEPLQRSLLEKNVAVSGALSALVGRDESIAKAREKYLLEGLTGTYASMPKPKGDAFTADHQPQAAVLEAAAEFDYFSDTGELAKRAAGRAQKGYAINLHSIRHVAGSTFGSKGKVTKEAFLARIKPLVKGKKPVEQRKTVVVEIRADLNRDVKAMQVVAAADSSTSNWKDVMELSGKKEDKEKLIAEIRGRIKTGEAQIAAQNLDALIE